MGETKKVEKQDPTVLFEQAKSKYISGDYQGASDIMDYLFINNPDQENLAWKKVHMNSLIQIGAIDGYKSYPAYIESIRKAK